MQVLALALALALALVLALLALLLGLVLRFGLALVWSGSGQQTRSLGWPLVRRCANGCCCCWGWSWGWSGLQLLQ